MTFPGVITPRDNSRHRLMFERGYRREDETLVRRASIGYQFDVVRQRLGLIALEDGADAAADTYYAQYSGSLNGYVGEQVDALVQLPSSVPYPSRRLNPRLYSALTDQLALLPVLASCTDEAARNHRRALISAQGMYGIIGNVLASELGDNVSGKDRYTRVERKGFIHETTPVALLNREQNANAFALPPLPVEDEVFKVDFYYYIYRGSQPLRIFRQVKADELAPHQPLSDPRRLVGGRALGNLPGAGYWPLHEHSREFPTARAIVDEIEGRASSQQSETLDVIETDLVTALHKLQTFAVQSLKLAA